MGVARRWSSRRGGADLETSDGTHSGGSSSGPHHQPTSDEHDEHARCVTQRVSCEVCRSPLVTCACLLCRVSVVALISLAFASRRRRAGSIRFAWSADSKVGRKRCAALNVHAISSSSSSRHSVRTIVGGGSSCLGMSRGCIVCLSGRPGRTLAACACAMSERWRRCPSSQ